MVSGVILVRNGQRRITSPYECFLLPVSSFSSSDSISFPFSSLLIDVVEAEDGFDQALNLSKNCLQSKTSRTWRRLKCTVCSPNLAGESRAG